MAKNPFHRGSTNKGHWHYDGETINYYKIHVPALERMTKIRNKEIIESVEGILGEIIDKAVDTNPEVEFKDQRKSE